MVVTSTLVANGISPAGFGPPGLDSETLLGQYVGGFFPPFLGAFFLLVAFTPLPQAAGPPYFHP